MRIRSPSLHELHALAATARLGSFSRAADELCVTQGAVSRAVARLESHVGQPLLLRRGRRTEPSAAGRAYLEMVVPALQSLESAAIALAAGSAERLRLSVPPTLAAKWLIPRLPAFHARHPEVALSFVPYRRDDPLDDVEVDSWIRVGRVRPGPRALQCDYVVGREIVPICRPQDLHGRQALRTPADLLARPLLFHTHYPDNWRLWFAAQGLEARGLHPAADFDQVALLVQGVIAGLGQAVVQRCLVEEDLEAGRVALAFDRPVSTERGYYLCQPAQRREQPAMAAFRRWITSASARPASSEAAALDRG